jgi:hypothetical protein
MRSAVAFTEEIDDVQRACDELVFEVRGKIDYGQSTIGVVFCDADAAVAELGCGLHEQLGIDIIGVTTTASLDLFGGYHDMGIVLTVITGDDVDIAIGNTGELLPDSYEQQIRGAYADAAARLEEPPRFIYLCAPYIANITSDKYLRLLDELSGHAPVFGGVATDHYDLKYQKTFHNGTAYDGGLVFVLFSGNICPVFAMEHEFSGKTEGKAVITKSCGNQVERVGDRSFLEYITSMSPVPDVDSVIFHFQSTPFVMEMPDYDTEEQPIVRALATIDRETGAGGFLSDMPEGSALSISILQRDNLRGSCESTLSRLVNRMRENPDYSYSTVLVNTCNARHLMMGDKKDMEANIVSSELAGLGPSLNVVGYYGFGEMCPTAISEQGDATNRFHNVSFAVCAI